MSLSDPDHRAEVELDLKAGGPRQDDEVEWFQEQRFLDTTDFTFRLPRNPIVPGSLKIEAGNTKLLEVTCRVTTNDAGMLLGDVGAPGGGIINCVHHLDGQVSIRFKTPVRWYKATYAYRTDLRGTYA